MNARRAANATAPLDDHIDSFVALDLKTGAIKWATRLVPFDTWNGNCFVKEPGLGSCPEPRGGDLDFGHGPMLYSATVNGEARDLLAAGQKSGMFWGIDRDSGKVVWGTQVGPGGQSGGTEWGSATDGKRLYIAIANSAFQDWPMQPSGIIATGGMWSALDPATGKILWQTAEPTGSWVWGPVSEANGVLYAGSMDPKGYICERSTPPRARSCGRSHRAAQSRAAQRLPMAWSFGDRDTENIRTRRLCTMRSPTTFSMRSRFRLLRQSPDRPSQKAAGTLLTASSRGRGILKARMSAQSRPAASAGTRICDQDGSVGRSKAVNSLASPTFSTRAVER